MVLNLFIIIKYYVSKNLGTFKYGRKERYIFEPFFYPFDHGDTSPWCIFNIYNVE